MTAPDQPFVTLKLATSLDSCIALEDGQSKWITGPEARAEVHRLRASHDGLLTGVGTVLADDPQMTVRTGSRSFIHQPWRIVLDTHLRIPREAAILKGRRTWIFHGPQAAACFLKAHCTPVRLDRDGHVDLIEVLSVLKARGLASIMIEAGARLAGAALKSGCVNQIEWFRASTIIGADGSACVAALGLETLQQAPTFRRIRLRECGDDLWETYQRG